MKLQWIPTTRLGKWSLRLLIISLSIIMASALVGLLMPQAYFEEWFLRDFIGPIGFFGVLCGIAAFVLGLISYFRHKERGGFILVVALVGLYLLFLLIGELLIPH